MLRLCWHYMHLDKSKRVLWAKWKWRSAYTYTRKNNKYIDGERKKQIRCQQFQHFISSPCSWPNSIWGNLRDSHLFILWLYDFLLFCAIVVFCLPVVAVDSFYFVISIFRFRYAHSLWSFCSCLLLAGRFNCLNWKEISHRNRRCASEFSHLH